PVLRRQLPAVIRLQRARTRSASPQVGFFVAALHRDARRRRGSKPDVGWYQSGETVGQTQARFCKESCKEITWARTGSCGTPLHGVPSKMEQPPPSALVPWV